MVSTRQGTKSCQIVQDDPSGDNGEDYGPEEEGSGSIMTQESKSKASGKAVSKQKGKQPERRRGTGRLSKLPDMPLDVLYEIFSLVHPVDLLRMSWASKAFRNVLTSKSSRQVWIATFDNIPEVQRPPPCPEDLTEIAYTNLLYNPRCMDCGGPRASAYWEVCIRVCMGCIKNRVTIAGGVEDKAVVALSHNKIRSSSQVLPFVYIKIPPLPNKLYVFTRGLKQLTADLEATDDEEAVLQRYRDTRSANSEFAGALESLERIEKVDRVAVLAAARDRRLDQILEKLADEGWDEELLSHRRDYVKSLIQVKGVKVARPLTEKSWGEMEDRILEAMRACKNEIEDKALKARCVSRINGMRMIIENYKRTLHPHDFCPSLEDICRIPDTRRVIIYGTDEEFDTCAEEVTSGLPELSTQFLEERTAELSALLPFGDRPNDPLSLATAWFNCGPCHRTLMHGNDALEHQCLRSRGPYPGEAPGETTFDICVPGQSWCSGTSRFTFSKVASAFARELILDCGEDPETITLGEMNSKLHRFAFPEEGGFEAINWHETLRHKYYNPSAYHQFLGLDESREFVYDPNAYSEKTFWHCRHCWRRGGTWTYRVSRLADLPTVKNHITDEHGVDAPAEGADYYYHNRYRPPIFVRSAEEPVSRNPSTP